MPATALVPLSPRPSIANCTWRNYSQPVDHFSAANASGTFLQRVCLYTAFHQQGKEDAPIFFYTGNESPVEEYVNSTGLMWELGASSNALLVWAEHRFEPGTHPSLCGTQNCFAFGTSAQALEDYAALIATIRDEYAIPASAPAIAFGGSYGGMLAGWMRIRYPHVIAGAIAASAPVWGLATTMTDERLDWSSRAIARGLTAAGGATDRCLENVRSAWPLIEQLGRSPVALRLMGTAAKSCGPLANGEQLSAWARAPWFYLAEGNFPYASTYIPFAVGAGLYPLPAWPLRTACSLGLDGDVGIRVSGDPSQVLYNVSVGSPPHRLSVQVDWATASPSWAPEELDEATVRGSGVLELVGALSRAVAVWYNVTGTEKCFPMNATAVAGTKAARKGGRTMLHAASVPSVAASAAAASSAAAGAGAAAGGGSSCAACPPCDDCPPCPLAECVAGTCEYHHTPLAKAFSWTTVTCNEDLHLYNNEVSGIGRDLFWPPSVSTRHAPTVEEIVGPQGAVAGFCGPAEARRGLPGGPTKVDRWSGWLTHYYRGANLSNVRNIVWSNGLLDPWSGGGVYPPGGGIDGPMIQNVSADGSQIALLLDVGAHHLDLFHTDPADPPCARTARKVEAAMIARWADEWRRAHS
jgi:lysosomal Pro-X carboxypeptidase